MNDLAVIICYQNFLEDKRVFDNFVESYQNLTRQGLNVFTVEAVPEDKGSVLPVEKDNHTTCNLGGVFWSKENLINFLVKNNPNVKKYSKVVWLDPNILIEDDSWPEKMSTLLDEKNLVHVGSKVSYLNEDKKIKISEVTGGKAFTDNEDKPENYNLGLGWGVRKDFFEKVGLFDFDVSGLGGNELITFLGCTSNVKENDVLGRFKSKNLEMFFRIIPYNKKALKYVDGKIGCLDSEVKSLYSGSYSIEKYKDRFNNVKFSLMEKINISQHIKTDGPFFKTNILGNGQKVKEILEFETEFYKYLNYIYYGEYKLPKSIILPNPPSLPVPGNIEQNKINRPPQQANVDPRTIMPNKMTQDKSPETVSPPMLKQSLSSMGDNWKEARREVYEAKIAYERALRKEEIIYNNFIRGLDTL